MKKTNTIGIIILVLLISAGFAAVATNLIINGNATIGANENDFDVYFTSATTEEGSTATINPSNNKEITYVTKELSFVGNSSTLDYTVYNNSSQYDANVNVLFNAVNTVDGVDYSSYYSITYTGFDPTTSEHTTSLPAKTSQDGSITITLTQPLLQEVEIQFTLTLVPSATERTEEAVYVPPYTILSGDLDTIGSEVKIANEEFYVIGQEDANHVKLLSKWNLNVGSNAKGTATGLQDEDVRGYRADGGTMYGNIVYSNTNYWPNKDDTPKPEYGSNYPLYVYTNAKNDGIYIASIAEYVDDYVDYLNNQGVNVFGRLIKKEEVEALINNGNTLSSCFLDQTASDITSKEWVYQTSYWTGTADYNSSIWSIITNSIFGNGNYHSINDYGVRPVIILEK